jgi:hypothetical protein
VKPAIMPRLIDADLVAIGYTIFGALFGLLSVSLAFTSAPPLFIYSYAGLSVLLIVCAVAIDRAARPGFYVSPIGHEARDAD